jgi:hypothetical protein
MLGLIFSQILLTPNPIGIIDSSAKELLEKLASGFGKSLQALEGQDAAKAQHAVQIFSRAHDSLIALENGIGMARNTARWTLRGRFVSREVKDIANRYERHAVRLYASSLLFAEAFADALRKEQGPAPRPCTNAWQTSPQAAPRSPTTTNTRYLYPWPAMNWPMSYQGRGSCACST